MFRVNNVNSNSVKHQAKHMLSALQTLLHLILKSPMKCNVLHSFLFIFEKGTYTSKAGLKLPIELRMA